MPETLWTPLATSDGRNRGGNGTLALRGVLEAVDSASTLMRTDTGNLDFTGNQDFIVQAIGR